MGEVFRVLALRECGPLHTIVGYPILALGLPEKIYNLPFKH